MTAQEIQKEIFSNGRSQNWWQASQKIWKNTSFKQMEDKHMKKMNLDQIFHVW